MERDKDIKDRQVSETGEIPAEEAAADATGARAGEPQTGENPKDTRIGIVNEANFGTD